MINKRYTDEEILKALECCLCDNSECLQCDDKELCKMGRDELAVKALDLITRKILEIDRLKTEIERLKEEVSNTRRKALLEASSKFAGHSNYHGDTILCKLICTADGEVDTTIPLDMSKIKSEACKEFAEKLKEIVRQNDYLLANKLNSIDRGMFTIGFEQAIDEILKEMVGDE